MSEFLDIKGLNLFRQHIDKLYQEKYVEVPQSKWYTDTPFVIPNDVIQTIYKGDVVGKHRQWLLLPYEDSEDQVYTAVSNTNRKYSYGTYNYTLNAYPKPWEIWTPVIFIQKSILVDW